MRGEGRKRYGFVQRTLNKERQRGKQLGVYVMRKKCQSILLKSTNWGHFYQGCQFHTSSNIGELQQQRRRRLQKRHLKVKSCFFKLYRAYSISFSSSNIGNLFQWSCILKDRTEVQGKKTKVVVLCSRFPQNMKLGIFTS